MSSLLRVCQQITNSENFPPNKELLPIVCELAASREVYEIIDEMMGSAHNI
jgi:hypothetical protein